MNKFWRIGLLLLVGLGLVVWQLSPTPQAQVSAVLEGLPASMGTFARVNGPENLAFPKDWGAHPDTQTEWWYFTGNLSSSDGRKFGYQLTFFRRGLLGPDARTPRTSAWATDQVFLAHFALTDVNGAQFHAFERIERGAAGMAGAVGEPVFQVWLRDWTVEQVAQQVYHLHVKQDDLELDLELKDIKGPVLQGDRGYSQKGPDRGNASTYVSMTRLLTSGSVVLAGGKLAVSGTSWMDHEYGTSALASEQIGWDWFSIQLDDGRDLMVYTIRRKDGTLDAFSRGAIIAADGGIQTLSAADFVVRVNTQWKSPHSGGVYPSSWTIEIPKVGLVLNIAALLADQELNNSFVYWEGAVQIVGTQDGQTIRGVGYTELTGYARSFEGGF
jgi:predicted secreted hydrolase